MSNEKHTSVQWWGAFDVEGNLRAVMDSETEAHFYVRGRGHMYHGSYRPVAGDVPRLIAKAPEMLAALMEIRDYCQGWIDNTHPTAGDALTADTLRGVCRAAIAKAEGGA